MTTSPRTYTHEARPGITLVEVMAALVLVAVGLLGIAGSSALLYRVIGDSAGLRRSVARTSTRFAALGATGCASAASGAEAAESQGTRERWVVLPGPRGFITVIDSVGWTSPQGARLLVTRTAVSC